MVEKGFFGFYYPNERWASDNQEHSRLVAHKVYVGKVISPLWEKKKSGDVLRGHLDKVCGFDLGQIVLGLEKGEPIFEEIIIEKNKIHPFPDGSYIVGDHKRKRMIDPYSEEMFNRYLELAFDLDWQGGFGYTFNFRKDILTRDNLFMFLVENYVIIDCKELPLSNSQYNLLCPIRRKNRNLGFIKKELKNLPFEFVEIVK